MLLIVPKRLFPANISWHAETREQKKSQAINVCFDLGQAAREGASDGQREQLKAQMLVLHLRSRIHKEVSMQVRRCSIAATLTADVMHAGAIQQTQALTHCTQDVLLLIPLGMSFLSAHAPLGANTPKL